MLAEVRAILFDWGDTLMLDDPGQTGSMVGWPEVSALPDALETLRWARQIGPVCIASGAADSDSAAIRAALARVGLAECVDHIFCRRELGWSKTDPRFWWAVSEFLALPAQQILMVGDNYEADVLAPRNAGLQAVWLNWRHRPSRPGLTISALRELPQVVRRYLPSEK